MIEAVVLRGAAAVTRLNSLFTGHIVNFNSITRLNVYTTIVNAQPRKQAKNRLTYLVGRIAAITSQDDLYILRKLYGEYVSYTYNNNHGALLSLFSPIINSRR